MISLKEEINFKDFGLMFKKKRRSSANCKTGLVEPPGDSLGKVTFLVWAFVHMDWIKAFPQRIYRYGESGSPCLKPRYGLTSTEGIQLTRIQYIGEETQYIILSTKEESKPRSSNDDLKNFPRNCIVCFFYIQFTSKNSFSYKKIHSFDEAFTLLKSNDQWLVCQGQKSLETKKQD